MYILSKGPATSASPITSCEIQTGKASFDSPSVYANGFTSRLVRRCTADGLCRNAPARPLLSGSGDKDVFFMPSFLFLTGFLEIALSQANS